MAKFNRKTTLASELAEKQLEGAPKLLNAIDFIESKRGLGVKLYPIQRIIIKSIFAVPFDYKPVKVPMYDVFREKLLRVVSEEECLHILYEEGRCNVGDWRDIPERGYNEACIIAGRRGGKLLSIDELIPTPDGFVRNGDLKRGDSVLGEDGRVHKITIAHPIVEEEAYKVSFDDGTFTYAHGGHLWKTYTQKERKNLLRRTPPSVAPITSIGKCKCGCGNAAPISKRNILRTGVKKGDVQGFIRGHQLRMPRFSPPIHGNTRTTEEIFATLTVKTSSKGPQVNHAIALTLPVELPEAGLPIDPYCLGYWLGDGTNHCGIVTIDPSDAEEVLTFFTAAGYNWHPNERYPTCWHVLGIANPLRKLGVLKNKHIPKEYLWASSSQRLSLLQGLCDSDGYCASDGQVEFCNTNKNLAEGVYHLASSLGLKPFFHEGRATLYGKDCGPKYRVTWTGKTPVFRLKRKLIRVPKKVKSTQLWRYITAIEPVGKMQMRCITTDNPTHLYLFGKNFNVTHNSEVVASIGGYKLYLLLNQRSPQEYFNLVPNSPIDFTFLAQDDSGSNRLYNKLREGVNRAPFFGPYLKDSSGSTLKFVTEADRGKPIVTPTVICESRPCLDENELIWGENSLLAIKDTEENHNVLDLRAELRPVQFKTCKESPVLALETINFRHDPLLLTPQHTCFYIPRDEAASKLPYLFWRNRSKGSASFTIRRKKRGGRHENLDYGIVPKEGPASGMSVGDYMLFPQIPESARSPYTLEGPNPTRPFTTSNGKISYTRNTAPIKAKRVGGLVASPVVSRLLGLYLAEGCIEAGGVKWTFHSNERDTFASFVQSALLSEFQLPSTITVDAVHHKCDVRCHSIELAIALSKWFGKGCASKTIPTKVLYWPRDCQTALIRGFLDGDGSDNRDIAQIVSQQLAYSLFALMVQAGMLPSVMHKEGYTDKHGMYHQKSWIIEACKQERAGRFFQQVDGYNYYWSKVSGIRAVEGTRRVVDIGVEGTHSFLTKLGAVHNCTTNATRSPSNVFLALDEFAHFRSEKGSTSDEVYGAATPSCANFHHAELLNGEWIGQDTMDMLQPEQFREYQDHLVLSISSPWTRVGKMHDLHKLALEKGKDSSTFTMRVSSAEMNPRILPKFLRDEYEKNPMTFKAEYGGQFLDSSETYVTEAQIRACTDVQWTEEAIPKPKEETARLNLTSFHTSCIGRRYFWGVDLGMLQNATAVAIGHLEHVGGKNPIMLVYDYIDRMMVGEKFVGPGVEMIPGIEKYKGFKALPLEDILLWLRALNSVMPCFRGVTDQHGGQQLVQLLEMNQIYNIELLNLTTVINSQMAFALKGYMDNQRCRFPYVPKFMNELRLVEAEYVGKYQIRVSAPEEKNATDDMCDATEEVAYAAQKWLMDEGGLRQDPSGISLAMQEQQQKPAAPILNLDGVNLIDMKLMERMRKMRLMTMMVPGTEVISNPWHRRGRR